LAASSATTNGNLTDLSFNLGALAPNTTYFVRVGALYNGATSYADTVPASTSTLTSLITGSQFYRTWGTSVTVNWLPLGSAQGYRLEAASDSGFTAIVASSVTTDVAQSTLTVVGLATNTTYYFRVGGINHNDVVNYVTLGSTHTTAGLAPVNQALTAVYVSSMAAAWTDV